MQWCERTSIRHNAEDRAKIEETSVEKVRHNDPRSHAKLEKSTPKTIENRLRSDLGRFEAIRVVQRSATDAPKTAQERPETRQGRPKGALGSAWAPQDAPQNTFQTLKILENTQTSNIKPQNLKPPHLNCHTQASQIRSQIFNPELSNLKSQISCLKSSFMNSQTSNLKISNLKSRGWAA